LDVTGTTVITPRPSRRAVPFAPSLLTMTAGRVFRISPPTAGSNLIHQTSPRFIGHVSNKILAPLQRLGLALSYRHTVALGKGINNVKTQIMPCMAIALSRVAQPHDYIHTFTTISVHYNYTITECPALALPDV